MKAVSLLLAFGIISAAEKPLMEGNKSSPVKVLIYEDLQCGDCAAFRKMLDEQLMPKYGEKVLFEHRDFPLPKHAWARMAAVASRHFQDTSEELALKWRRQVLHGRRSITVGSFMSYLEEFATANNADPRKAVTALSDKRLQDLVEQDYAEGVARGIARTPTALVNGEPFIETFTFEQISAGIDRALADHGVK